MLESLSRKCEIFEYIEGYRFLLPCWLECYLILADHNRRIIVDLCTYDLGPCCGKAERKISSAGYVSFATLRVAQHIKKCELFRSQDPLQIVCGCIADKQAALLSHFKKYYISII